MFGGLWRIVEECSGFLRARAIYLIRPSPPDAESSMTFFDVDRYSLWLRAMMYDGQVSNLSTYLRCLSTDLSSTCTFKSSRDNSMMLLACCYQHHAEDDVACTGIVCSDSFRFRVCCLPK